MSATLINGDCLEQLKKLPARSVDCFICDLPYGQLNIGRKPTGKYYDRKQIVGCDWDVKLDLASLWVEIKRLCKNDDTPVLMFCNTKFGFELYNSNPDWFRYDLVWNKGRGVSFLLANKMPMKSHEMIYVFSKKGSYYKRVDGMRCPLSVLNFIGKNSKNGHPTEKSVELYTWLLERYCRPGGRVLDPTAGSFNSIIAAKQLGLHGIGIEKDNTFFNKAIQKMIDLKKSEPKNEIKYD